MGTHSEAFSGGAYSRWASWTQADPDPSCAGSGTVDSNTGAQWHMLPQSYPNYKTVHRRFQTWCCNEILRRVLTDVANELRDKGALDEEEWLHRCDVRYGQRWRGGNRTNEAPKRHENHGDCGSPWIAADSDPLDEELRNDAIEMIAPHRSNRSKPPTQDRRRLSRYMRRWLVERFFAWIQWQRRILVRWEYHPQNFLGFVQLACLVVLFRRF